MKVTEVRISPAKGGKVRAFASVIFDDSFIVNDLRVIEGREGQVFVTMPARKTRNGQMRDIAHPLNSGTREEIEQRVLEEYESARQNRVVGDRDKQGPEGEGKNTSVLDRLSARLFNEEFWASDTPLADDRKE
ncbi:MAG: septation protein SpoVG family protein [Acidobacteria bacterium]|nr:septation protein SpoVG family protein [Candidatus Sulfomarinibacter kjeldsenii]